MKRQSEHEIKDLLTPPPAPKPPAGLAERIKSEIPDDFELAPAPPADRDNVVVGRFGAARPYRWLIAAGVVMAVGGGFLGYRLQQEVAPPFGDRRPSLASEPAPGQRSETAPPPLPKRGKGSREAVIEEPVPEAISPPASAGESASSAGEKDRASAAAPAPPAPVAAAQREAQQEPEASAEESPVWVGTESEINFRGGNARVESSRTGDEQVRARLRERLESLRPERPDVGADVAQQGAPSPEGAVAVDSEDGRSAVAAPVPAAAPKDEGVELAVVETRRPDRPIEYKRKSVETESLRRRLAAPGYGVSEAPTPTTAGASTGGTAEPNDAPYGDVFFQGYGTNPFVDTEDDRLSTFGLDVDTGSYTVVRRYLRDGHLPPPEAVRVEELVNYFDYGDPAPRRGDFAIHAEGAPSPFGEGERYYLLRFNLHGREVADDQRPPAILTFVVDTSGSMARENRLGMVKEALAMLLHQLRPRDRVALVVYGSQGRVLLDHTSDHSRIRRAVDELRPEGSTNAEEGLRLAYDLAAGQWRRGTINRVILCSDGVANVGRTSAESILSRIRRHAERGIELTTVGFGMGNYNDVLMERLADTGNGRYAYVDTLGEAQRIFVENLTGTLQTIAIEARVQVDFNPRVVARYRLLGYENRDVADERFRDDSVDAGEIGAGHTVTALYELKLHQKLRSSDEICTLHLRYGSFERSRMMELSRTVTGKDFARRWNDASPALRLSSLVAEFGEILKQSYWAKTGDLREVYHRLRRVGAEFRGDREVAEFVDLVGWAAGYRHAEEDEEWE